VVRYPEKELIEEMSFVAYHFHWARADILELEHAERRGWVQSISEINDEVTAAMTQTVGERFSG